MKEKRYCLLGKRWYAVATCIGLAVAFVVLEDPFAVTDGKLIFEREKCIGCHSFKGQGGAIGPDLTAVAERRSDGWISDQIRHPEKHDPATRMPSFGHLSRREIRAIVRYFKE